MMIEDRKVVTLNGTGFATAVATGVVALVIGANKDLSPKEIKDILITTADKSDNDLPMVNPKRAVELAVAFKKGTSLDAMYKTILAMSEANPHLTTEAIGDIIIATTDQLAPNLKQAIAVIAAALKENYHINSYKDYTRGFLRGIEFSSTTSNVKE